MQSENFHVYILTNQRHTVLYIGITNNLERRLWEHSVGRISYFTRKYNAEKLIYFELFSDPRTAIEREKQLKRWSRVKKETLIARMNPDWRDLGKEMFGDLGAKQKSEPIVTPRGPSTALRSARDDR